MPEPRWRRLDDAILQDDPVDRLRHDLQQRLGTALPEAVTALLAAAEFAPLDAGLVFRSETAPELGVVRLGLASPDIRRRCERHAHERLVRALAIRPETEVVDLSAGFARDALLCLAAGAARVTLVERNPLVAALTRAVLELGGAAGCVGWLSDARWQLQRAEACRVLSAPQAIRCARGYFDPMFELPRRTALPRNELALIARLATTMAAQVVDGDDDAAQVIDAAAGQVERLVVKRHRHAPTLGRPSHVLRGARVRFDVYVRPLRAI